MAIVQPSCNHRWKPLLFLYPMLRIDCNKRTLATNTEVLVLEDDAHDSGNASSSGGIDLCANVRKLCKQGRLKDAIHRLHIMDQRGIRPDSSTYSSLLQECVNKKALQEGKLVHAHMIDMGFNYDIFLGNKLVVMYAKCGSIVDARRELDRMPERNVVSWTTMIAAYARHGFYEEALRLFYQMQRMGIEPDQFTFASILPACANMGALEHGKKIHEDIVNRGFQSSIFVGNALVDMYAKCGRMENARQLFDKMPERNVVSCNAMIAGYAQNGHVEEAMRLFREMPQRDVVSWNAMIAGYAQDGYVNEATKLFQKMSEQDVVSWTTMIAGYAQNGRVDEALKLFKKMPERNAISWNAMIGGYAQNGRVDEALNLFEKMPDQNVVSWNAMIAGYAQNGHVDEAFKLFQKMPERNLVSWTAMIAGYEQNGHFDEALKLFREMELTGVRTVPVTFSSVLPACASLSSLKHGKEVHANIIRSGLLSDIFVGSALVDMYAKCGHIEDAYRVFEKMSKRDVVSWNAMIVGYAIHGCGKEALQLFEQMQQSHMKPNHVTFIGVLSACCHAGLVDEGWEYFDNMNLDYHIIPAMEHYCCMVDLLGRAGRLDEAQDFINRMPIKPNAVVWRALLGACRIHTNIELGEHVAERLFELEPKNAACYVVLSNIYAAAGRWNDAENVRKLMKDRRLKTRPGCSWIEVNNKVYSFIVGDKSHPQMHELYAELERLSGKMKEAGYVPNTNLVLHDVEEEQKEHILCHHSEKLAIAFGLIHTSPGTPLKIVKNLRVCSDCHSATKFISRIVAREIVVRDANRFHHFKNGWCSCGDYW